MTEKNIYAKRGFCMFNYQTKDNAIKEQDCPAIEH